MEALEFENKDLRSKSKFRTSQLETKGHVDQAELEKRVQLVYKEMEQEIREIKQIQKQQLAKKEAEHQHFMEELENMMAQVEKSNSDLKFEN